TYLLAPGADPARIRIAWHGAERAILAEDGALVLTTPVGTLREAAPVAWQARGAGSDGEREPVEVRFELLADGSDGNPGEVGLALGAYDPGRALTVDPTLTYAGFIGGNDDDVAEDVAIDSTGAAYLAGFTESSEAEHFPVAGGPDLTYGGGIEDAFVVKV